MLPLMHRTLGCAVWLWPVKCSVVLGQRGALRGCMSYWGSLEQTPTPPGLGSQPGAHQSSHVSAPGSLCSIACRRRECKLNKQATGAHMLPRLDARPPALAHRADGGARAEAPPPPTCRSRQSTARICRLPSDESCPCNTRTFHCCSRSSARRRQPVGGLGERRDSSDQAVARRRAGDSSGAYT